MYCLEYLTIIRIIHLQRNREGLVGNVKAEYACLSTTEGPLGVNPKNWCGHRGTRPPRRLDLLWRTTNQSDLLAR
jgi:hypothetical protein